MFLSNSQEIVYKTSWDTQHFFEKKKKAQTKKSIKDVSLWNTSELSEFYKTSRDTQNCFE